MMLNVIYYVLLILKWTKERIIVEFTKNCSIHECGKVDGSYCMRSTKIAR